MKRIPFVLAIGAALAAIAVSSAESRNPYVGLYRDAAHSDCDVFAIGFMSFELWIWWYPGSDGLAATMHKLVFPANVVPTSPTANPECTVVLDCLCGFETPTYCCRRVSCAIDWTWSHHILCFLLDANPSWIEIVSCPGEPFVAASCAPGYPVEPVTVLDNLALNRTCARAAESISWGAVKSLYR